VKCFLLKPTYEYKSKHFYFVSTSHSKHKIAEGVFINLVHVKNKIELNIYCDEIYEVEDPSDGSKWMYIGALFVPLQYKEELLTILNNCRCIQHNNWHHSESECSQQCRFHTKNNTEIHYNELGTDAKFRVAEKWINFIQKKACINHRKILYFNILGLNLTKMDLRQFGTGSDVDYNLYNRFYRTVLKGGLNYFFKDFEVVINTIYHDAGNQQSHDLFPWHAISKVCDEIERVNIINDEIQFIDSDHRKSNSEESHLIQLMDIILGATYVCLHGNTNSNKKAIGFKFKPVMEVLVDRKRNPDGPGWIGSYYREFNHFKRAYQVSFFPKREIPRGDIMSCLTIYGDKADFNHDNPFYFNRPIIITDPSVATLDRWF